MNWATIAFAGIVATTVMTVFMAVAHRANWANGDMVRALGSLITRNYENSFLPGLIIKFGGGIFFAFIYAAVVKFSGLDSPAQIVMVNFAMGAFHGLAIGMMLAIAVAEHHPLEQFRSAGVDVVLVHFAGHIIYGLTLGLFFASRISETLR